MNLIFTWDDIKQILRTRRKIIVGCSFLFALVTFMSLIFLPLQYEARATFKQSASKVDQTFDLKNLIRTFSSGGSEGTATTLMLSDTVLEKTIEALGLQIETQKDSLWKNLFNNCLAEIGKRPQDRTTTTFSDVHFTSEKPLNLTIKKTSETDFIVSSGESVMQGKLGESILFSDVQFTVNQLNSHDPLTVTVHPLQSLTPKLRQQITIKPAREDKNLLVIKCRDPDRRRSAQIVNTLMQMYEHYLIEENQLIINAQLAYLNQRQDELSEKLTGEIRSHAELLKKNIQSQGYLGIKDEMEMAFEPLQTYQTRLSAIELELSQIGHRLIETPLNSAYSKALAGQMGAAKSIFANVDRKEKNPNDEALDLANMTIDSARTQTHHYSAQMDDLYAQLKQIVFLRDHLFDPNFEISTLSNVVPDAITQQMVQKSMELESQLHDELHQSSRDRDRIKTTLTTHKRFLESHLNQTLDLGKIRIDLLKEKLYSLYRVMQDLLTQEKTILQEKIGEMKESMQTLPDLWVNENRLKFKSDLTKGMMEGLVNIAETKNLTQHLYQVESRPLDWAKIPLGFIKPRLIATSILLFFVGLMASAFCALIYAFIYGFPVSLKTLRELGAHTSGMLSLHETNLETLRHTAAFLMDHAPKGVVAIIGEKQTPFFPDVAKLLRKYNRSSCIIDCSFGKIITSEDQPGLAHALKGKDPLEMLHRFPNYDYLPVGESTSDSVELLKSREFTKLIEELARHYDYLFLISRTPIDSLESEALLKLSTQAIIVAESPLESLKSTLTEPHVTFVQIET